MNIYSKAFTSNDLSDYQFLVTGGAGFIGSNITEYLLKHNAGRVCVLDNLSTGSADTIEEFSKQENFTFIEGDISDPDTCKEAVKGVDYISHQAALGSVPRSIEDPINSNKSNVTGFLNMLVAARDEPSVKGMVYAASSSTYGDSEELPKVEEHIGQPLSPYAVTKYVNELYADVFSKVYNFHTIGLRYFNVFGPRQAADNPYAAVIPIFMKAAIEGHTPTINGDGKTTRDFTFVSNAVQANIKALFNKANLQHEVVNIACNEQITLDELWETIAKIAGSNITPDYGPERPGDVRHSLADISKAREVLNYGCLTNVKEGLKISYNYYLDNMN